VLVPSLVARETDVGQTGYRRFWAADFAGVALRGLPFRAVAVRLAAAFAGRAVFALRAADARLAGLTGVRG
jgi:hypothetical protein